MSPSLIKRPVRGNKMSRLAARIPLERCEVFDQFADRRDCTLRGVVVYVHVYGAWHWLNVVITSMGGARVYRTGQFCCLIGQTAIILTRHEQ